MKSLTEYLENANHYLFELSGEQLDKERQKAIVFCEAKKLEENFQKQVEEMPDWLKLAESANVTFFIEEPIKERPGFSRNAFIETGVFIRIFDMGKIPTIKVIM